jgi:hypothetical protein
MSFNGFIYYLQHRENRLLTRQWRASLRKDCYINRIHWEEMWPGEWESCARSVKEFGSNDGLKYPQFFNGPDDIK